MLPKPTEQLEALPPYIFVKMIGLRDQMAAKGNDVIDLGQGSPDLPTPAPIVEALCRSVREDPSTHRYPTTKGTLELRRAIASWYQRRFDVQLDPETEVLPLVGSKEGLAHLCFSYLTKKDVALVPSPCYPVHYNAVILAQAKAALMPLKEEDGFLPDLRKIPAADARRARMLILNYPNNPTGATVPDLKLFEEAVAFAKKRSMLVVHDNAYSELCFGGYRAPSFLQAKGAKDAGVEFHSLSKSFNMAGWRIGFAVGNAAALAAVAKFKSFLDYGAPGFIQAAAAAALNGPQDSIAPLCRAYKSRQETFVSEMARIGWTLPASKATMYLWGRLPAKAAKMGSLRFAEDLIVKAGVVVAPGIGFGPFGEGYVRFALIDNEARLREAARRIGKYLQA